MTENSDLLTSLSASTNWQRCALCQKVTSEVLQCPDRSTKLPIGIGYISLAEDLQRFQGCPNIPLDLNLSRLNDGNGIESTLRRNRAQWHKICRLKFNKKAFDEITRKVTLTQPSSSQVVTRSAHKHSETTGTCCFFCDELAPPSDLHEASTFKLDTNVRRCAVELNDTFLLAKLAVGDMIAIRARYHYKCLLSLYKRAGKKTVKTEIDDSVGDDSNLHEKAFAELVDYITDVRRAKNSLPLFKLVDLATMYKVKLVQLGLQIDTRIHTSRLKDRLISTFPHLKAFTEGRDTFLIFDEDIGPILKSACTHDSKDIDLKKTAKVIREDIFKHKYEFNGTFDNNCQDLSSPSSLLALVNMILYGDNPQNQSDCVNQPAALTISQLIVFNSIKKYRSSDSASIQRHSRGRETPLPLYLAMKIHAQTRSKDLIDSLCHLGLSVSYFRLLQLSTDITNGICEQYKEKDIVCPSNLRHGLLTTAAVDNIDHNPSSTTSKESFHGTGISLIQHPSSTNLGIDRGVVTLNQETAVSSRTAIPLPCSYTLVPPLSLKSKEFTAPAVPGSLKRRDYPSTKIAEETEQAWLNKVKMTVESSVDQAHNWVSWSAFFADISQVVIPPPIINALLPLFLENAHSAAMIRHSMDIVKKCVQYLNPGQVPIMAADQPLYALAKQIQWSWPEEYGEDNFIVMFGGLHIEMAILKLLGDWLDDSGWTNLLTEADIARSGTANSFIKALHVTKTRRAHQVTAACLHILLLEAYTEECSSYDTQITMEQWCEKRVKDFVYFDFWLKTLSLELLLLRYIRALREGNFELYVESLTQVMPWFFALDHTHYSRWLSVHIRDMMTLSEKHPDILIRFQSGQFVAHKTKNKFSVIALDQCHEQNNALVKGVGGAIGLTNNPSALRRWMIAGPELARIIGEFENSNGSETNQALTLHHEQNPKVQKDFIKDVTSLLNVFKELGNPFLEHSEELLVIDSKNIMDVEVADSVRKIETIGAKQYEEFVTQRLEKCTMPVTNPIPKNKLALFSRPPVRYKSKQKEQLAVLKSDCSLFSRLFISCQVRDGDLDNFFSHENHAVPPSLSNGTKIRLGTKSDIAKCLKADMFKSDSLPLADATIFDGAAIVHMLSPGIAKTFQEYADLVFLPYVRAHLVKNTRIDIVWDTYRPNSLKSTTREKRGRGTRKSVAAKHAIPKNWKDFLRVNENKRELFELLSQQVVLKDEPGKEIYATQECDVLCSSTASDVSNLAPCLHEEADTRVILHLKDVVQKGFSRVTIRTVDTDILVLAVTFFNELALSELWVAIGVGTNLRCIAIHEMVTSLDHTQCKFLPIFHAFTGCDTVSAFGGRGKKTAWDVWKSYPAVNEAFNELTSIHQEVSEDSMLLIERFVVLMYDRVSEALTVNEARKLLFTHKSRAIENIPPTRAALVEHVKRVRYQALIWNQATIMKPDLPDPSNWGWTWDIASVEWVPVWTMLPEAAASCSELIKCQCKKGCAGRCKCRKAALKCTALCFCSGDCS